MMEYGIFYLFISRKLADVYSLEQHHVQLNLFLHLLISDQIDEAMSVQASIIYLYMYIV